MTTESRLVQFPKRSCLTDDDLYAYVSGQGTGERIKVLEAHLVGCADCRRNLSELLELLNPADEQYYVGLQEVSREERDRTLMNIREVARRERSPRPGFLRRFRVPVAAAAAAGFITFSLWGLMTLYQINKSEAFYSQALTLLEQNYAGASPGKLRLALPFSPVSVNRSNSAPDSLDRAENLFFQALAVKEDMVEAHLGLASIYLTQSKFSDARAEFQKVIQIKDEHTQALIGRGVTRYEEGIRSTDPIQRDALLRSALGDFDTVLKADPESAEALYNKIWTQFMSGLHREALQDIESYLAKDSSSDWAESLKELKTRMQATSFKWVEEKVNELAISHNTEGLLKLASAAPYQMPPAIWSAVRRWLMNAAPAALSTPNAEDLLWAAGMMEAGYRSATGDGSFRNFIDFHVGLSPPQKDLKRSLDRKFQALVQLHQNSQFDIVLRNSQSLENQYRKLGDYWQLMNLHHLRGSCLHLGKAAFEAAEAEFRKMLEASQQANSADLTAKSLSTLGMIYGEQGKYDDCIQTVDRLYAIGSELKSAKWLLSAHTIRARQYRRMGQFEQALHETNAALGLAYQILDGLRIIENLENQGVVLDRLGRIEDARNTYRIALEKQNSYLKNEIIRPHPEATNRQLNILYKQGELALRANDYKQAEAHLKECLSLVPSGMRELEGRNRVRLAEVYLETNRTAEAEGMLAGAMIISRSGDYPDLQWQTRFIRGRILEQKGGRVEALAELQQAIEILERMRRHIEPADMRQSFFTDRFDPYRTVVGLLYDSHQQEEKILDFVERAKSMTLREHLDLRNVGQGSRLRRSQDASREYPIIEYFFAGERLLVFFTDKARTETIAVNASREKLRAEVDRYLESIRNNDQTVFTRLSKSLYAQLIAPVEKSIPPEADKTVLILPDGPLHLLPFAGLQDSQGRYLIEKTPIAFAPSRAVLRHCLDSSPNRQAKGESAVLIDGSAGLAGAREELNYLSRVYRGKSSIIGSGDLVRFREAFANHSIVHFSGHAVDLDRKPALLLQSSPGRVYLDCKTINTFRMPRSYLVNLAGCSTGIGPLSEGEAPWGLIPAFLNAGAPAIIASLMPVDDASTQSLSRSFYALLQDGTPKAKALQLAQVELLAATKSSARPQLWIPYFLVGNPR